MNFENLQLENFLTIGKASLKLADRGLLLIQGQNIDDTSASSNGAGKSSIVDGICWVLYGVTARGTSGDAVVNRGAKKNCSALLTLDDDGVRYQVERYRKHATNKNQLLVFKLEDDGSKTDMSKGTERETQEIVTALVGCSLEVFVSAVYAGQEKMPDLPSMTDKMLKTLIEEAAGIEVLAAAYDVAKAEANAARSALERANSHMLSAHAHVATTQRQLEEHNSSACEFTESRLNRAKEKLATTLPLLQLNKKLAAEKQALQDTLPSQEKLDEIDAKLKAANQDNILYREISAKKEIEERAVAVLKSQLQRGKRDLTSIDSETASIESLVGKPCGECGKTYAEHDLADAKSARTLSRMALATQLRSKVATLKAHTEASEALSQQMRELESSIDEVSALHNLKREAERIEASIGTVEIKSINNLKSIETIKADAKAILHHPNPFESLIKNSKAELAVKEAELLEAKQRAEKAEKDHALALSAAKVFGPSGVRAHILDTVTPFLNDRTRDYLGALSDGNIHATWSTLSTSAKGEVKEKFAISVINDCGSESFAGLSGGEKRKVRLATAMAMQDMVASRATKPLNIFIGDEIDHALDDNGLERLMTVLERKARERGTVLVISHNSLQDWIPQVITVVKESGFSTISDHLI